jgi:hypothetical protein
MDIEQIIQWAREAGFSVHDGVVTGGAVDLEAFAKLVAAHEREECAKVCETHAPTTTPTWVSYAAAIRARGNHA